MDVKMNISRLMTSAAAVGLAVLMTSASAYADTTVHVTLWDKGPDSATMDEAHPMGPASAGANLSMAMLGVKADVSSVPAGKVTFDVTNESKDIVHEMILSPMPDDPAALPYVATDYKVDEDAAGHLGEVSELDPGKGGQLTLDLKPGKYILFCNIPGHFMGGMWTVVTVTS